MSTPILVALPGYEALAGQLRAAVGAETCNLELRQFPDGETYLRYLTSVAGRDVIVLAPLDRPDPKFLPVVFAAATARDLGATRVGLVAPYLPYMRQDRRFHDGEAITSAYFAGILSSQFDWLVTVDPHLHRHASLSEVYGVPSMVAHAEPLIGDWIRRSVDCPLIIGPDSESEQWAAAIANRARAPYAVLQKRRHNDHEVEIILPESPHWSGCTPILVDDIASTAQTMVETLRQLKARGYTHMACVVVHGIFAGDAYRSLWDAGAAQVVSCNTVPHESNAIDVAPLLADAIASLTER